MKRILLLLTVCLLALSSIAQKQQNYAEEDIKQFYRTIQGNYTGQLNDTTTLSLYFTPIWEREDDRFHWLYMEAVNNNNNEIIEQKILEICPVSDISFKVVVHGLAHPEQFVGKWSNRNYFDGFNTSIFKGKRKFNFMKTKDFEYQTGWSGRKNLKCFPSGERIHFKFVQEDERLYVRRLLPRSSDFANIVFFKAPID